jgi:hypothetical protein
MISAIALARALYSAFIVDLDMVCFFLALHGTRLFSRNIANPSIDLLSPRHLA